MRVRQIVNMKFDRVYAGWSGLEFSDINGNQCVIEATDDQVLLIEKEMISRADRIRKERSTDLADEMG